MPEITALAGQPELESSTGLKRELGLWDSTMIVAGSMIGSGIFIVSSDISRQVGSPFFLLLIWVVTGLLTLTAALSYGELAGMMPAAGGQYVYLKEAYNPLVGFMYGWTLFLVIQTGLIAAVAVAFAKYTALIIPWFASSHKLMQSGSFSVSAGQLLAIASVALLTFMNERGVKTGKYIQLIFTVTKLVALAGLIILGFWFGLHASAFKENLLHFFDAPFKTDFVAGHLIKTLLSGWPLLLVFGSAMVGSLFSSDAWNTITFTAGEVINPRRNIPLSLFLGTLIVTLLYTLANVAYLMLLPIQGSPLGAGVLDRGIMFASDDRVAAAFSYIIFGAPAVTIMAVLVMISTFGCNNGLILSGARVYYAMGKDGLFFQGATKLNKNSVPGVALILQGVWIAILCLSGGYGALLDYVVFAVLIFYVLTIAGVIILRYRQPNAPRPYKAFGYPFIPILYIIVASAIAIDLLIVKWETSRWGALIVLLGIPVYYLFKRRGVPERTVS